MPHSEKSRSSGPEWGIDLQIGALFRIQCPILRNRGLPDQNEALTTILSLFSVFNAPFGGIAIFRTEMGHWPPHWTLIPCSMPHFGKSRSSGSEWGIDHQFVAFFRVQCPIRRNRHLSDWNGALISKLMLYSVFNAPFGEITVFWIRIGHWPPNWPFIPWSMPHFGK